MNGMTNPLGELSQAAIHIRGFNHSSIQVPAEGWEEPADSYTALGTLSSLVAMLEQAVRQSTRPVMRAYEHGRILIDGGGDADRKVAEMIAAQNDAVTAADALTAAVQRMHNATSPMGWDTEGLSEFKDDTSEDDQQPTAWKHPLHSTEKRPQIVELAPGVHLVTKDEDR